MGWEIEMGEVITLNLERKPGPQQVGKLTDLQLAILAHERASDLFHALNLLSAHAGHLISHMQELLRDDPRINTPEFDTKLGEYNRVWIRAQEALIPGVTQL